MKLFRIPDRWDFHECGGYVIMAQSPEQAKSFLREHLGEDADSEDLTIDWEEIEEIQGNVYVEYGCH